MKSVQASKVGPLRDPNAPDAGLVEVVDIPEKPLGPEDVRIKVAYCAICGSDPHCIQENVFSWDVPFGLGHEVSGVITELGPKATKKGLKVGDRVAGNFLKFCGTCYWCQNGQEQFCANADDYNEPGMSESIVWHESQVYRLPDSVSLKEGCLFEPLTIAVRIVDKAQLKLGQRVFICGGGPIGLLTLQAFKAAGATSLTLSEPLAERRALAQKYGADHVLDPTACDLITECSRITGGLGYDVVVDCSGSTRAIGPLPELTAYGGTLLFSAQYPNTYEYPLNLYKYAYKNELTISGTYIAPYAFPRAMQLLPRMQLADFTDCIYPLDDVAEAFREQLTGKHPKILIKCNDMEES